MTRAEWMWFDGLLISGGAVNKGLTKMTAGLKAKCLRLASIPSGVESYMCFSQSSVCEFLYDK